MLDFMVPLNDGRKVVCLGFEIISKLESYFLMAVTTNKVGTFKFVKMDSLTLVDPTKVSQFT